MHRNKKQILQKHSRKLSFFEEKKNNVGYFNTLHIYFPVALSIWSKIRRRFKNSIIFDFAQHLYKNTKNFILKAKNFIRRTTYICHQGTNVWSVSAICNVTRITNVQFGWWHRRELLSDVAKCPLHHRKIFLLLFI